ncbi:dimethylaniline monooxygenase [N-oxide-forming] 2-like [Spea bombifrons]|uniref:dimethylaniline monooxygenase [N-oxide-forming] 2-like n=1 Tax=Spea bombifrons TaxID=233779 RepID=UPI00234A4A58|nr:dimethylaniline monooxygenase [N-oxide-forming] 2-like [Spea bombifrons]
MVKTVGIIGAGVSGLTAIKSCLEEGLQPTCFERNDIGGLWNFREDSEDGRPSIYKSLVSNVSKETMSFSDFPIPEDFPNFLPHVKYLEYCKLYAEHFQLLKYIKFKTVVCSVEKHLDFKQTGQWVVITESDDKKHTTIFDAVMICSGQHVDPLLPMDAFPGINKFKGKILHCRQYKRPIGFDGKKVLIIGMGNSGVDLSTELCTRASQVYLSTKRGVWVLRRLGSKGYPYDVLLLTRYKSWIQSILPLAVSQWLFKKQMNNQFNHHLYDFEPEGAMTKEPLVNEELPSRILSGSIIMKPGVIKFMETSVQFSDGTTVDNIDIVIFATGYNLSFPFLDESVIKMDNSKGFLYKKIIPVDIEKPTLAFIGFIQPVGSIMVAAELQNRWATRLFKGLLELPSKDEMKNYLVSDEKFRIKWFGSAKENSRRMNYVAYLDELASQIKVKPNILKLLLTDPVLALKVFFGPLNSYQYRLTGPGKWAGARDAIMTQWDRIEKPLRTRGKREKSCSPVLTRLSLSILPWIFFLVISLLAFWIKS